MKKSIVSLIIIFALIANVAIAQETSSTETTTEETVESFCKNLVKAIAENDKTLLNSYFPTVDELIAFMEASGVALPPDLDKNVLNMRIAESFKDYIDQIEGLRHAVKQQSLDWDKMKIGEIETEKVQEYLEEDDSNSAVVSYKVTINLTLGTKQIIISSGAVFNAPSGFRIGEISDWKIKDQ